MKLMQLIKRALVGIDTLPRLDESPSEGTTSGDTFSGPDESYYERMVRLKPVIDSDEEIRSNIASAFAHEYDGQSLNSGVRQIGRGGTHVLYHIGNIGDPLTQREIHIAVRLWHWDEEHVYDLERNSTLFARQLSRFEKAFDEGRNPPYFAGVVTWRTSAGKRIAGFILEDVSENKRYELIQVGSSGEYFYREGFEREKLFLDPLFKGEAEARKYLSDEARIDVS